ncbi:hypothetical protein [Mesorhizobium sp. 1B3]|uniref:hypothetical protein n=1 Tax=Mesorhizobium sp. 1B3 TaxID=3243599 RepID=UPI003D99B9FB
MTANESLSQRWESYRPSKALWFWSAAGAAVATMIVGFTAGGWTTGGTAAEMARDAARNARAELAASVCVEKFVTAANASQSLAQLKEASSYQRDDFITDGGWAKLVGLDNPVPGAADLCAEQLAAMDAVPVRNAEPNSAEASKPVEG